MQVEILMPASIINLRGRSKSYKDKLIFRVSKNQYKTEDMGQNTIAEKQSIEKFYHIIHMDIVTS